MTTPARTGSGRNLPVAAPDGDQRPPVELTWGEQVTVGWDTLIPGQLPAPGAAGWADPGSALTSVVEPAQVLRSRADGTHRHRRRGWQLHRSWLLIVEWSRTLDRDRVGGPLQPVGSWQVTGEQLLTVSHVDHHHAHHRHVPPAADNGGGGGRGGPGGRFDTSGPFLTLPSEVRTLVEQHLPHVHAHITVPVAVRTDDGVVRVWYVRAGEERAAVVAAERAGQGPWETSTWLVHLSSAATGAALATADR